MINLQLEGLGRASHSDGVVLQQATQRPRSRRRMACVTSATPMTNEADKLAKAAKQAAFSPLNFLKQPWGRDAVPSEPEVTQEYVALAEEAKHAAAIIADAERRAAQVQQDLDEQHQHVSALLMQLRQMNAESTEAGLGQSMLVPLETVPTEVRTMLDQQLRRAAELSVVAAPEQPAVVAPPTLAPPGERFAYGSGYEVLLQGFNWESHKRDWYKTLRDEAEWYADIGFTVVWMPPPTASVSPEGYMPTDYYNLNSKYGSPEDLKRTVDLLHSYGLKVVGDVVLNHRCALHQDSNGIWNVFGGKLNWNATAIVGNDPNFRGRGHPATGDNFHAAPNIDHQQQFVRDGISEWLQWLRSEYGFDGWRLDFAKGFSGEFVKEYCERSEPLFVVGEYWDSLKYHHGVPDYNQDEHRQRIVNWLNSAGGLATAFDVTTKGILHEVFGRGEYWRLRDHKGKPPGVMGWWPSRSTSFLENHDTGSTQGHWRFPHHGLEEGYAYILTHPGTPTVFYDHLHEGGLVNSIKALIQIRKQQGIHCKSTVEVLRADQSVYAAKIDKDTVMKIGYGDFHPGDGWHKAASGRHWAVWARA